MTSLLAPHSVRSRRLGGAVALFAVAIAFALLGPLVLDGYWLKLLTLSLIYVLPAMAVGVLFGRLGIVALNHIALLGVGGWVYLRFGHLFEISGPLLLLIAGAVTAVVGLLIGLPSLRLSGLVLALFTLMSAGAFEVIIAVNGFPDGGPGFWGRSGGEVGPQVLARPTFLASDGAVFQYTVLIVAVMWLLTALLLRGRVGRAWAGIRRSEVDAYASGINVAGYKLIAIAMTSFLSGIGGGLLATIDGQLNAVTFPTQASLSLFAIVLIGGAYRLAGALISGLFFMLIPAVLQQLGLPGNIVLVLIGLGLIQVLWTSQRGIIGEFERLAAWLSRPKGVRVDADS